MLSIIRKLECYVGNHRNTARAYYKGELTLYGYAAEALAITGNNGRIKRLGYQGADVEIPARSGGVENFELVGPTISGWRECNVQRLEALKAEFAERARAASAV